MTLIKSISGIRGTIGGKPSDNLTPIDVVKFTTAYARFIKDKNCGKRITVVVGRDARLSGSMVENLVEGTLLGTGVDVINVGLCTTPGTEMAVITHKADGGIIITASHNPRQWNALKLLNERGEFLDDAEGKQVLAMAEEEGYNYPAIDDIGHVVLREDFNPTHIKQVLALPLVDVEAVRKRKFKVVVSIVIFQNLANVFKLFVSFWEFFCHLSDRHWCTNTCNNVFALCVYKKFTHEALITCSRVTCKCNTGTALVAHVTECHLLYVNCCTP